MENSKAKICIGKIIQTKKKRKETHFEAYQRIISNPLNVAYFMSEQIDKLKQTETIK